MRFGTLTSDQHNQSTLTPRQKVRRFAGRDWCRVEDLNPRPTAYKAVALPTELTRLRVPNTLPSGGSSSLDKPQCKNKWPSATRSPRTNGLLCQLSFIDFFCRTGSLGFTPVDQQKPDMRLFRPLVVPSAGVPARNVTYQDSTAQRWKFIPRAYALLALRRRNQHRDRFQAAASQVLSFLNYRPLSPRPHAPRAS